MANGSPTPHSVDSGYPRKRARTRGRLRRAGMVVLAAKGPEGATVGEIAAEAGVAAGTFYNHFPSLGELVDEVADELGTGVEIAQGALEAVERDPAARVAIGMLQLLALAEADKTAASAFVALVAARPSFRARVRAIVARAIADGADSGRFGVDSGPAAIDAVLGTALQSMRSIILGETEPASAPLVAALVLRTLGVDPAEAGRVVPEAQALIRRPVTAN